MQAVRKINNDAAVCVDGFAQLANPNDVGGHLAYHYEEKRLIARRAAELMPDSSTIMMESGSCCALLARELADRSSGVTIVSNSAFIANYVRDSARVGCVLMGGSYQRGAIPMRLPGKKVTLITCKRISDAWRQSLERSGVAVTLAKPRQEEPSWPTTTCATSSCSRSSFPPAALPIPRSSTYRPFSICLVEPSTL